MDKFNTEAFVLEVNKRVIKPKDNIHKISACATCTSRILMSCGASSNFVNDIGFLINDGDCPLNKWSKGKNKSGASVTIIWPWLGMGGAERWIIILAKGLVEFSRGFPIEISRVNVVYSYPLDIETLVELEKNAALYKYTSGYLSLELKNILNTTDYVIIGGYSNQEELMREIRTKNKYLVIHSACDLSKKITMVNCPIYSYKSLTSVSEDSRNTYPEEYKDNVKVLENGIEVDRCLSPYSKGEIRKMWGIHPDQIVISYIGRISSDKNLPLLANVAKSLGKRFTICVFGKKEGCEDLLKQILDIGEGRLLYMGRYSSVGVPLGGSDIWINLSPAEGWCLSRGEASVAGVPVISTPVGSLPDLNRKYGTQAILTSENPTVEEVISLIYYCRDNPKEIIEMVNNSRNTTLNHFTSQKMCGRWLNLLNQN